MDFPRSVRLPTGARDGKPRRDDLILRVFAESVMSSEPRVLAIHAHPDDIEFQCAGTLALLKQAGCSITIATMTPGDCGSAEYDSETIAEIRRGEARKSAELLGADYLCLEFRDLAIFNDDESRRRVVEAIRRTRPDIIFSP